MNGILSPEQYAAQVVGKAVLSTTANTFYSLLRNEQLRQFVDLLAEDTTMTADAQKREIVEGPGQNIANLDFADGQVVGGLGCTQTMAADDELTPTFGGRQINLENFEVTYPYEKTCLPQDNIEGPALEPHVQRQVEVLIRNDMERIAIRSQIGGANPAGFHTGNLTTIDGWRIKANGGNVYDHAGGFVNPLLFEEVYGNMPRMWRNNGRRNRDMRFYTSDTLVRRYRSYLSRRLTPIGDVSLTQENQLEFAGIPIIPVADIVDTESGVLSQSGSALNFTWILLVERANLLFAYGPEMRIFIHPSINGKFLQYNWWGRYDVQFERIEAVSLGVNIQPSLDPAIALAPY